MFAMRWMTNLTLFLGILSRHRMLSEESSTENYLPLIDSLIIGENDNETLTGNGPYEDLSYVESINLYPEFPKKVDQHNLVISEEVPETYLHTDDANVFPTERPSDLAASEVINCKKIHCYIRKGDTKLDCTNSYPRNLLHNIQCSYYVSSNTRDKTNQKNVKVILKTELDTSSEYIRHFSKGLVNGTIGRLLDGVREEIEDVLGKKEINFWLTLSYIHFDKVGNADFLPFILKNNLDILVLWNPNKWAEDTFIPENMDQLDSQPDRYFRLKIYCEEANKFASFNRLWLPFEKWSIRLEQCPDLYVCRKWPKSYKLCYNRNETFLPKFMLYPRVKSTGPSINSYILQNKPAAVQTFSNSECRTNPQADDSFESLTLDRSKNCWNDPKLIEDVMTTMFMSSTTVITTTKAPTTTTAKSTTTTTTTTEPPTTTEPSTTISTTEFSLKEANIELLPSMEIENSTQETMETSENEKDTTKGLIFAVVGLGILNLLILLCLAGLFCWFSKYLRKKDYKKQPPFPSHYNNLPILPKKYNELDLKVSKDTYMESFNSDSTNINSENGLKINNPATSQLTCNTLANSNSNSPQITPKVRSIFLTKDFSPPSNDYTRVNTNADNSFDPNLTKEVFENPDLFTLKVGNQETKKAFLVMETKREI